MGDVARRQYSTIIQHLTNDPDTAVELVGRLDDDVLSHVGAAVNGEIRRRAIAAGDQQAIIDDAFQSAFGRDGLGSMPWKQGRLLVCPGAIVSKSRSSHTCRFVSVNDVWIWDSHELIIEEKQSNPGPHDGFRAVGLLPLVEGLSLDVVSGRLRGGQHQVTHVTSFQVRNGELIEVSQRSVGRPANH